MTTTATQTTPSTTTTATQTTPSTTTERSGRPMVCSGQPQRHRRPGRGPDVDGAADGRDRPARDLQAEAGRAMALAGAGALTDPGAGVGHLDQDLSVRRLHRHGERSALRSVGEHVVD